MDAPLIDDRRLAHDDDDGDGDDNNEDEDDDGGDNGVSHHENRTSSLNAFVWTLTFTAGISGLLFGYECVRLFPSPINCKSSFLHRTKSATDSWEKKNKRILAKMMHMLLHVLLLLLQYGRHLLHPCVDWS